MVGQLIENLSGKKLESCEITCLTLSGQPQPREDCWLRWPVSQEVCLLKQTVPGRREHRSAHSPLQLYQIPHSRASR